MSFPLGSDPWLDARLRNVPLPPGMLARLHDTVEQLATENEPATADASTGGPKLFRPNQPVPIGETLSNEQMDRLLAEVSLPPGLLARLERISLERRRRIRPRTLALAASLLLAVGVAYAWRAAGFSLAPLNGDAELGVVAGVEPSAPSDQAVATIDTTNPTEAELEFTASDTGPTIDELRWRLMQEANLPWQLPHQPASPNVREPVAASTTVRSKDSIFASDRTLDTLPEIEIVDWQTGPRGIAVPLVAGYDLRFQSRFGQHPFVVPAAHKQLRSLQVPLTTSTASYDLAWQQLGESKLPPARQIRVEEFLAAFDYGFAAAAPGSLALRTAGGPAPWSNQNTQLMQVGIQAGSLLPTQRTAASLVVLVDTSASMRRGGRLAILQRALSEFAGALAEGDKLSLVSTSNQAKLLLDAGQQHNLPRVLSAIDQLQIEDATNLGMGMELAVQTALAQRSPGMQAKRVVVLTDGLTEWTAAEQARLLELAGELSVNGATLDVIQVGGSGSANFDAAMWQRLTQLAGGKFQAGVTAAAVRQRLVELLEGRSQLVARNAALTITFNPQAVAAYRLLGHEPQSLTGANPAPLTIDLQAGQAATALIELKLTPQGDNHVATVALRWQDPASGEERLSRQQVTRLQFAKFFAESPLSLQTAALAALTAEVLRNSPFTSGKSLVAVNQLADQCSPLIWQQADVKALLAFVEAAEKVRLRGARSASSR